MNRFFALHPPLHSSAQCGSVHSCCLSLYIVMVFVVYLFAYVITVHGSFTHSYLSFVQCCKASHNITSDVCSMGHINSGAFDEIKAYIGTHICESSVATIVYTFHFDLIRIKKHSLSLVFLYAFIFFLTISFFYLFLSLVSQIEFRKTATITSRINARVTYNFLTP